MKKVKKITTRTTLVVIAALLVTFFSPMLRAEAAGYVYAGPGYSSYVVWGVETALRATGYSVGSPDYYYDPTTQAAVSQFQARHNLPQTGIVDATTYNLLMAGYRSGIKCGPLAQPQPAPQPAPQPVPQPAPQPVPQPAPQPAPQPSQGLSANEQWVLNTLNSQRAQGGLKALAVDPRLMNTARLKAQDLVNKGYYGHISPTYGSPNEMMRAFGITGYSWLGGENIVAARTVSEGYSKWLGSVAHRNNMFNSRYTHIGIGVVTFPGYGVMMVLHLAG
ncbi:MAG: peptidoglycan-binding protein [Bacillota bacterium]